MSKIVQKDNRVLHTPAEPVPAELFGSAKLKKIISDMSEALAKEDDGVALAAPQIAVPYQIFIIAGKIFSPDFRSETKDNKKSSEPDLIFINPKITKISKTKKEMEEGCLSVRWKYGLVKRSTKVTVEAYDLNGKKFSRSGSGLVAQIFQHEMDHLSGILFTDKAKDIQDYKPEK